MIHRDQSIHGRLVDTGTGTVNGTGTVIGTSTGTNTGTRPRNPGYREPCGSLEMGRF